MNKKVENFYLRLPIELFEDNNLINQCKRVLNWIQTNPIDSVSFAFSDLIIFFKQNFSKELSPHIMPFLQPFIEWVYHQPDPISNHAKISLFTSLKSIFEDWGVTDLIINEIEDKIHTLKIHDQIAQNLIDITSKDDQKIQETRQLLHSIEAKHPQDFTLLNFHTCIFFVEENYEKAFENAELGLKAALPHELWRAAFNVLNIAGILSNEKRITEILETYKDRFQLIMGKRKHTLRKEKSNFFRDAILTIQEKFPNVRIPASYQDYL